MTQVSKTVAKKQFCLRFDVDTAACIEAGVPALLAPAERQHVYFTFHVNMGRAVSYSSMIRKMLFRDGVGPSEHASSTKTKKLGSLKKLGHLEYIRTAILNPVVGAANGAIIRRALNAGHEIGLHGGKNHATWQYNAHTWSAARIHREILWGKRRLEDICGTEIKSFSSPGWNGSSLINKVLSQLHFDYVADLHGSTSVTERPLEVPIIPNIRTRLTGEPGGVGYLEWLVASHDSKTEMLGVVSSELKNNEPLTVMYDHPCYAGRGQLALLSEIIDLVRERDYEITTICKALTHRA